MALFDMPRVPEPEVMDDSDEVEAYSSATAEAHLNTIDDTLVEHALRLVKGRERGIALDIGTGPGKSSSSSPGGWRSGSSSAWTGRRE